MNLQVELREFERVDNVEYSSWGERSDNWPSDTRNSTYDDNNNLVRIFRYS